MLCQVYYLSSEIVHIPRVSDVTLNFRSLLNIMSIQKIFLLRLCTSHNWLRDSQRRWLHIPRKIRSDSMVWEILVVNNYHFWQVQYIFGVTDTNWKTFKDRKLLSLKFSLQRRSNSFYSMQFCLFHRFISNVANIGCLKLEKGDGKRPIFCEIFLLL